MTEAQCWLKEGRDLADTPCEKEAYEKFLKGPYKTAEKEGGKRDQTRIQRGCLTSDWTPEQLSGKTVLVIGENGIGDEVLTIGCLSDLERKCGRVFWKCDSKLKILFTRSFPDVAFVWSEDSQPTAEGTIYSWELIGRFRKNLKDFPWVNNGVDFTPYLKFSAPRRDDLSARYREGSKKVVGLAWRSERNGEPLFDKTCDLRDVPHWGPFFGALKEKACFVSLQYGDTNNEIAFARWKYGVEIYRDESIDIFNDVDAAAAQIAAMDFVVSISMTAAHLAGAMGMPGVVLLAKKPFGHWRAGNDLCPWYPSLRPMKQTTGGDWKTVLEAAAAAFDHAFRAGGKQRS